MDSTPRETLGALENNDEETNEKKKKVAKESFTTAKRWEEEKQTACQGVLIFATCLPATFSL
jgi:hypothetical protein